MRTLNRWSEKYSSTVLYRQTVRRASRVAQWPMGPKYEQMSQARVMVLVKRVSGELDKFTMDCTRIISTAWSYVL
jgi:hypothetical protein